LARLEWAAIKPADLSPSFSLGIAKHANKSGFSNTRNSMDMNHARSCDARALAQQS
jgi:hypothetical protein